jgi:hypothetical protein
VDIDDGSRWMSAHGSVSAAGTGGGAGDL